MRPVPLPSLGLRAHHDSIARMLRDGVPQAMISEAWFDMAAVSRPIINRIIDTLTRTDLEGGP